MYKVYACLCCRYVHKTMECTRMSVADCGLQNVEDDLQFLSNLAADTCPGMHGLSLSLSIVS